MRDHPDYRAPKAVTAAVLGVVNSGRYKLLE
jgi:hypothetical protein